MSEGMSNRSIANTIGVSERTVRRDTAGLEAAGQVRGIDGKLYRSRPRTSEDRERLILECHRLAHRGMSIRQIREALLYSYCARASVGAVAGYLRDWRCSRCSGAANAAPEQKGGAA